MAADSLLAVAALRVISIFVCVVVAACEDHRARPNVLLISVDSLRRDHVTPYGYANPRNPAEPTTPAVARLAAQGVLFEDAVSTTSWTLPAHMAMLTGLADPLHGVTHNGVRLDPAFETLAEALRQRGYATGGFFSGPNLHPVFGFDQGFDVYVDCSGVKADANAVSTAGTAEFRDAQQTSHQAVTSPAVLAAAERWIRSSVAEKRPFFAFTHWWDPHYDYKAPAPYDRMYDADYAGAVRGVHQAEKDHALDEADLQHLKSLYDGEIRWTDDHISKLLALLDELGIRDDTLIVFTSDHGEEFFERGRWGHQRTLFDEVVRIPLVLSWPARWPAGARVASQVRIQDIYPTIVRSCGAELEAYVEGQDLAASWTAQGATPPRVQTLDLDIPNLGLRLQGARRSDAKFVLDAKNGSVQYFDLAADPRELTAKDGKDLRYTRELRALLTASLKEIDSRRKGLPAASARELHDLPDEVEQALKGLGYLGDGEDGGEKR